MAIAPTRAEVDQLFTDAGWHPARDVSERVRELAEFVIADLAAHDCQVGLFPEAEAFLRSYGFLDVPFPHATERTDRFNTCAKFCSNRSEHISELMDDTQQSVFLIGWERMENGLVVMDPHERMFYLHHSGTYYAGSGIHEAFSSLYTVHLQPIDDYLARPAEDTRPDVKEPRPPDGGRGSL
ncbi:SUKH-3 domain-containing protein [Streptomyces sp. NPDC015125]|uniref:SUKH-3 domain-containing protein n=1 Tax=Streptomyces sp. NPDC015125 TaxID=3364938 RepID=UPI0036FFC440